MDKYEQLKKQFDRAVSKKSNWDNLYRETLMYVYPERNNFTEKADGVKNKGNPIEICDSTATVGLSKFVSNLQSSLVPPMKKWVKLVSGEKIPKEIKDKVDQNLEIVTNIFFSSLQNSNFDTQIAEALADLGIGTGALLVLKGESARKPLNFVAVPLNELFLDEGPYGTINTVYRRHKVEIRNILSTWPDAKLPKTLSDSIEVDPSRKEYFIECTYPAKIKIKETSVREDGKTIVKEVERDGFMYCVLFDNTKEIIVKREQRSSPWVTFRWTVAPGEIYGRGPATFALPDIKSLNKVKQLILQRASIDALGMWMVKEDGVMNYENITPGPGVMVAVAETPGGMSGPSIAPFPMSGSMDTSQIVINDLKLNINEIMFTDPLGPIDMPVKSATEVSYRQQNLAKRIGSSFGRLQHELITPLIDRILFILNEWELLPTLGDEVIADGIFVGVQYQSPLAMAQSQESLVSIQQFVQFLAGTFGPQMAMTLLQSDKLIKHVAGLLGISEDIQLSSEQLETIKNKIGQLGQAAEEGAQNQLNNNGTL
jgi:hypothetical protein